MYREIYSYANSIWDDNNNNNNNNQIRQIEKAGDKVLLSDTVIIR